MKSTKRIFSVLAVAGLLSAGCATRRTTQTTAPTGPVQTASTQSDVIPAGTTFGVRTNQTISSAEAGKTFDAEVAQDITNQSGQIIVPKGSRAELVILEANSGGAVGTRTVELGLRSVTVNGQKHSVTTGGVQREGEEGLGANRRTAEMVGGGAALGTLIGAVAGGGKGAAIGAATGAAAGAAAQVYTRGKEVHVPAESVLNFRLDQPLYLS